MKKNDQTLNFLRDEFIGKFVKVKNKKIEGKIIDETKNSFLILRGKNRKNRILKRNCIFEFVLPTGKMVVDGNSILMRPEERIRIKKWKQEIQE